MNKDTIITGVTRYFNNLSVNSIQGYRKVSLIEADNAKNPTGAEFIIDATESVDLSISKTLMQHNAESKKVYMDGAKKNPNAMSIKGHIDTSKLNHVQRLADNDVWMYISMSKEFGGAKFNGGVSLRSQVYTKAEQLASDIGLVKDGYCLIDEDVQSVGLFNDCKLYTIKSLNISDIGFINTVAIDLELVEVVLFDFDVEYKYGVKTTIKNNTPSAKAQDVKGEVRVPAHKLNTPLVKKDGAKVGKKLI